MNILTKKEPLTTSETIETTLRLLGLNNTYVGFFYLIYGIDVALKNPEVLTHVCKGLYIEIASRFHTSLHCAERNIRTARKAVFKSGNEELLFDIFGHVNKSDLPSNASFIDTLTYYIKHNLINER